MSDFDISMLTDEELADLESRTTTAARQLPKPMYAAFVKFVGTKYTIDWERANADRESGASSPVRLKDMPKDEREQARLDAGMNCAYLISHRRGPMNRKLGRGLRRPYGSTEFCGFRVSTQYAELTYYVATGQTIPEGYQLDHKNDNCADDNPANLQAIPRHENQRKTATKDGKQCNRRFRLSEVAFEDIANAIALVDGELVSLLPKLRGSGVCKVTRSKQKTHRPMAHFPIEINGVRKGFTLQYAAAIAILKHGRLPLKGEHVAHLDDNLNNDHPDNLEFQCAQKNMKDNGIAVRKRVKPNKDTGLQGVAFGRRCDMFIIGSQHLAKAYHRKDMKVTSSNIKDAWLFLSLHAQAFGLYCGAYTPSEKAIEVSRPNKESLKFWEYLRTVESIAKERGITLDYSVFTEPKDWSNNQ